MIRKPSIVGRIAVLVCVGLLMAAGASAQSLIGKWSVVNSGAAQTKDLVMMIEFKKDSRFKIQTKNKGTQVLSVDGTWALKNKLLTMIAEFVTANGKLQNIPKSDRSSQVQITFKTPDKVVFQPMKDGKKVGGTQVLTRVK